jgi:cytoskeleton protein RodZ
MSQLGERLRAARESQGISLAQAAAETRILQRYLVALEDGDYQNLPGDVYTRGFIRNYAAFLGLSADELIELYRYERGRTDPIRVVPATSNPRVHGCVAPSLIGVFFVVLAMVGVTYLVLSATNRIGENAQLATIPTATIPPAPSPLPTVPRRSDDRAIAAGDGDACRRRGRSCAISNAYPRARSADCARGADRSGR